MTDFAIVFSSIIISGILITWGIAFACRVKNVYHYCRYKTSKDYEKLWSLLMNGNHVIGITPEYDNGELRRIWPHEIRTYYTFSEHELRIIMDGDTLKSPTKKRIYWLLPV